MPPSRRRSTDPFAAAEAAFKKATTPPIAAAGPKPTLPAARELVSLRLDRDVLAHFQEAGPGWQERINGALRMASGLATRPGEESAQVRETDG